MQGIDDFPTGIVVIPQDILLVFLGIGRFVEIGRVMMELGKNVIVQIRREAAGVAAKAYGADQELGVFREIQSVEHKIAARVQLSHRRESDGRCNEGDNGFPGRPQ